jgi:hypothetical protein
MSDLVVIADGIRVRGNIQRPGKWSHHEQDNEQVSEVRNRAIDVALDCEAAHYRTVGRLHSVSAETMRFDI